MTGGGGGSNEPVFNMLNTFSNTLLLSLYLVTGELTDKQQKHIEINFYRNHPYIGSSQKLKGGVDVDIKK